MGDEIAVALRAGDDVVREVVVGQHVAHAVLFDLLDGVPIPPQQGQMLEKEVEEINRKGR